MRCLLKSSWWHDLCLVNKSNEPVLYESIGQWNDTPVFISNYSLKHVLVHSNNSLQVLILAYFGHHFFLYIMYLRHLVLHMVYEYGIHSEPCYLSIYHSCAIWYHSIKVINFKWSYSKVNRVMKQIMSIVAASKRYKKGSCMCVRYFAG